MFNRKSLTQKRLSRKMLVGAICVLKDDLNAVIQKLSEFYIYNINIMYIESEDSYMIMFKTSETIEAIVIKQLGDLAVNLTKKTTQPEKTVKEK